MNQLLGDLVDVCALVYLDDILIFCLIKKRILKACIYGIYRLAQFKYNVKHKKCKLFSKKADFLATLSQLLVLVLFRLKLML